MEQYLVIKISFPLPFVKSFFLEFIERHGNLETGYTAAGGRTGHEKTASKH